MKNKPGFLDFMANTKRVREALVRQLLHFEGLDKAGKRKDTEIRAALHFLDLVFSYPEFMETQYREAQRLHGQFKGKKGSESPISRESSWIV